MVFATVCFFKVSRASLTADNLFQVMMTEIQKFKTLEYNKDNFGSKL